MYLKLKENLVSHINLFYRVVANQKIARTLFIGGRVGKQTIINLN